MRLFLFALHFSPIYESVEVVGEEGKKAKGHRQIRNGSDTRGNPKDNEHDIVRRVRHRVGGGTEDHEHSGVEARRDGKGAYQEVVGIKIGENEIERDGNEHGGNA